ncbi:MAG: ABZJ_00895 family protein [Pseudomonadota bacterium]
MLKKMDKNLRFAMVFLLAAMVGTVIVLLMFLLFRIDAGVGGVAFAVPLIAGMFSGQWHFQEHGQPTNYDMWMESLRFGGIGLVVGALMGALVLASPQNADLIASIPIWGWLAAVVGFYGLMVFGVRLGFGIGVRSAANKGA